MEERAREAGRIQRELERRGDELGRSLATTIEAAIESGLARPVE